MHRQMSPGSLGCLVDNVRMQLRPWTKPYPDRLCLITYRVTRLPTLLLLLACRYVLYDIMPFKTARKKVSLNIVLLKKTILAFSYFHFHMTHQKMCEVKQSVCWMKMTSFSTKNDSIPCKISLH